MKAGRFGLGSERGSSGSAAPRARPCHLCRSSSTPGKLTPRAVFAFTCRVCRHARRGRFQRQPHRGAPRRAPGQAPHPAAGPRERSRILRALPAPWAGRRGPRAAGRLRSALPGQRGSRGQGQREGEGEASRPLGPRSFSFRRASAQLAARSGP